VSVTASAASLSPKLLSSVPTPPATGVPPDATISLISNGQVIRHLLAKTDGPIETECRRDSYFRLEVRDKTKTMLALTNPIYIKIGRRR